MYNKIVIGIDQSYKDTGIAVSYNGKIKNVCNVKLSSSTQKSDYRAALETRLRVLFAGVKKKSLTLEEAEIICIIERIRLGSSKPGTETFLNFNYIKSIGALNALIIDTANAFKIPVYSVDTRSWKSKVIGTSKPQANGLGFAPEKWPTIQWCIRNGYEKYIIEEASPRKKKAVFTNSEVGKPYTYNDNKADAIGIALYGFCKNQKLEVEK